MDVVSISMTKRELIRLLTMISRYKFLEPKKYKIFMSFMSDKEDKIVFLKESGGFNYIVMIPNSFYEEFEEFCNDSNCYIRDTEVINDQVLECFKICEDTIELALKSNSVDIEIFKTSEIKKQVYNEINILNSALRALDEVLETKL